MTLTALPAGAPGGLPTVTHREMRNNSGELLRRVAAGESILVTNGGVVAAVIMPPPPDTISLLLEFGAARAATSPVASLAGIRRRRSRLTTAEILDDTRGSW